MKKNLLLLLLGLSGCSLFDAGGNASPPNPPGNPIVIPVPATADTDLTPTTASPAFQVNTFLSTQYFAEDSSVRFSASLDTLRFVYQSMEDDVYSNTVLSADFTVTQGSDGTYLIQGEMAVNLSDGILVGRQWKHSFGAGAVYPAGFPKGEYRLEMKVYTSCYCSTRPDPVVFKAHFSL